MVDESHEIKVPKKLDDEEEGEEEEENLHLFQEEALYLSSLHEGLIVVSRKKWLGLAAASVLLVFLIFWIFFGSLPLEVEGYGLFTSPKGVLSIESVFDGVVQDVMVKPGQSVKEGQELIYIYDPQENIKIEAAKNKYSQVKARLDDLTRQVAIESSAEKGAIKKEIEANEFRIEKIKEQIIKQRETIKNKKVLYQKGLIAVENLRAAEIGLVEYLLGLEDAEAKQKTLESTLSKEYKEEDLKQKEKQYLEAKEALELLEIRKSQSVIKSPSDGYILEVKTNPGDVVSKGELLIWQEYPAQDRDKSVVLAYFPVQRGKKIKIGADALIEVASINMYEYGMIRGTVTDVSDYAVTTDLIAKRVYNQNLAQFLMDGKHALVQVEIALKNDPSTFSGYEWTSGAGPEEKISRGNVCRAKVVVDEVAPIYYLLPLWRVRNPTGR